MASEKERPWNTPAEEDGKPNYLEAGNPLIGIFWQSEGTVFAGLCERDRLFCLSVHTMKMVY